MASFYDDPESLTNGTFLNYGLPIHAWTTSKVWDQLTQQQRDNLLGRLKLVDTLPGQGTGGGTLGRSAAAYIYSELWPDATGWSDGNYTSAQIRQQARENILAIFDKHFGTGTERDLSTNYLPTRSLSLHALYNGSSDPEMKAIADAGLMLYSAMMAANGVAGQTLPAFHRAKMGQGNTEPRTNLQGHYWLYWAEYTNMPLTGPVAFPRSETRTYTLYAAVSDWRPPAVLTSLASGAGILPYVLTSTGAGPGNPGWPAEITRYVYRHELYGVGSGVFWYTVGGFTEADGFSIVYESPDEYSHIDSFHPFWRTNEGWWIGLNSLFTQTAQYQSTAIMLFDIPDTDPWPDRNRFFDRDQYADNLIQEAWLRFPHSIDEEAQTGGWIFLREGDVYIAIHPVNGYSIERNAFMPVFEGDDVGDNFDKVVSPGAKNAVIFDIATREEFATFEAFQAAVLQSPLSVDMENITVTYTNVKGDTITAEYTPIDYTNPGGGFSSRYLARPTIEVNGSMVPMDTDFTDGSAVIKSPHLSLEGKVLKVQTPAGQLELDWLKRRANTIFDDRFAF